MALEFLSPIHKATRQVGLYLDGPIAEFGLSPLEGHVLSYLRSYAPCATGELHRVFGIKRSTLTSLLDRLVERGLVERRAGERDRRSVVIRPTARGRRLAARMGKLIEALEESIRSQVSARDRQGFRAVMAAIEQVTAVQVRPDRHSNRAESGRRRDA